MVHCTVKTFRTVPSGIEAPAGEVAASYTLLGVSAGGGREYKVLHADISSPLLTCDSFLVEERQVRLHAVWHRFSAVLMLALCVQFQDSLKVPWLLVGAQVKRLFATEDPDLAEWQEGR